ncbi:ABC transporter permease [Paracoccus aestuarii]|uniref:ABC transporter permease n=1 Tax=Paracoccus aestuarii TaxID=453842 RepID=A0A419A018_9RHOB|nr:ABC transporter permease [Paracoccus aestuarii]RJL06197.1 ABC transporter permease [Paracoccus aestuarii]WCQ98315.1 ABC transporter permease [Paracoccus aestuarii]
MTKILSRLTRFYRGNNAGIIGSALIALVVALCLAAPLISPHDPDRRVGRPHQPPSAEHIMGTTRAGKDVAAQALHGGRVSLIVALAAAGLTTAIALAVGVGAGYAGGRIDEGLMAVTNIMLVFPQLPLLIILAAFLGNVGPFVIAVILGLTSWPWGARVMRAQTLSLRRKEFVTAAEIMGESRWRIIAVEILPNLISLAAGMFVGTALYAIGAQAGLEFLGLGDPTVVSWGTMLYWAQSSQAFLVGAWWEFLVPGTLIALVGGGLALLNISIDQVSNPRLRTGPQMKRWRRMAATLDAKRREGRA